MTTTADTSVEPRADDTAENPPVEPTTTTEQGDGVYHAHDSGTPGPYNPPPNPAPAPGGN